jgi:anti-anti-sigma factor
MAVVEVAEDRNAVHLTVHGAVDQAAIADLKAVLAWHCARAPKTLVLDLRDVTEFSRVGLGVLVVSRQLLGDRLQVACSPQVRELVEETGLARVLTLIAADSPLAMSPNTAATAAA